MISYLFGFLKHIFRSKISIFALINSSSSISKKAKVNRYAKIYSSEVSDFSYIGIGTKLVNTSVGKYCSFADSCSIGLPKHTLNFISTSPIFTESKNSTGTKWIKKDIITNNKDKITIGNDVWIGNKVTIIGNVKIGDGAIIGAGAIVTKDVPDYAIVAGIPAKIIRYRFDKKIIDRLLYIKWWNMPEKKLRNFIELFQKENFTLEEIEKFAKS